MASSKETKFVDMKTKIQGIKPPKNDFSRGKTIYMHSTTKIMLSIAKKDRGKIAT